MCYRALRMVGEERKPLTLEKKIKQWKDLGRHRITACLLAPRPYKTIFKGVSITTLPGFKKREKHPGQPSVMNF